MLASSSKYGCSYARYHFGNTLEGFFEKIKSLEDERLLTLEMKKCNVSLIASNIGNKRFFVTKGVCKYLDENHNYDVSNGNFEFYLQCLNSLEKQPDQIESLSQIEEIVEPIEKIEKIEKPEYEELICYSVYVDIFKDEYKTEYLTLKYLGKNSPTELDKPIVIFSADSKINREGKEKIIPDLHLMGLQISDKPNCHLTKIQVKGKTCLALFPCHSIIMTGDTLTVERETTQGIDKRQKIAPKEKKIRQSNTKRFELSEEDDDEMLTFETKPSRERSKAKETKEIKEMKEVDESKEKKPRKRKAKKIEDNSNNLNKILLEQELFENLEQIKKTTGDCCNEFIKEKETISSYSIAQIRQAQKKLKDLEETTDSISKNITSLSELFKVGVQESCKTIV